MLFKALSIRVDITDELSTCTFYAMVEYISMLWYANYVEILWKFYVFCLSFNPCLMLF